MASGATATQLSFDLFGSTALATGLTLDAGGVSRPARQAAFQLAPQPAFQPAQRPELLRAEPRSDTGGDFQLTDDRGLAASWANGRSTISRRSGSRTNSVRKAAELRSTSSGV